MTIARHLYIDGRVQGVFFRANTRQRARELGLHGWVKNLPDGRVEAWLQGETDAVSEMLSWCRQGPPMSRVDEIEVDEVGPDDRITDFRVRY